MSSERSCGKHWALQMPMLVENAASGSGLLKQAISPYPARTQSLLVIGDEFCKPSKNEAPAVEGLREETTEGLE